MEKMREDRREQAELMHKHKMNHLAESQEAAEERHQEHMDQQTKETKERNFLTQLKMERNRQKVEAMKRRQAHEAENRLKQTEEKIRYINELNEHKKEMARLAKVESEKNERSTSRIRDYLSSHSDEETFKIPDWLSSMEKVELKKMLNKRGVPYIETKKVGYIPDDTYRRLTRKRTADVLAETPSTPVEPMPKKKKSAYNRHLSPAQKKMIKEQTKMFAALTLDPILGSSKQKKRKRKRKKSKRRSFERSNSTNNHTNADDVEYIKKHEKNDNLVIDDQMDVDSIHLSDDELKDADEIQEVPIPKKIQGEIEFNIGSATNIRQKNIHSSPEPYVEARLR